MFTWLRTLKSLNASTVNSVSLGLSSTSRISMGLPSLLFIRLAPLCQSCRRLGRRKWRRGARRQGGAEARSVTGTVAQKSETRNKSKAQRQKAQNCGKGGGFGICFFFLHLSLFRVSDFGFRWLWCGSGVALGSQLVA